MSNKIFVFYTTLWLLLASLVSIESQEADHFPGFSDGEAHYNNGMIKENETKPKSFGIKANIDLHNKEVPKLMLSAQAIIRKSPDELQIRVGVVTLSNTAEGALEENSLRMQAIVKGLEEVGLARSEYETGHFAIHPTYTPYPKEAPSDWKPSINGYEITNSIIIHTNKLDLAGKIIDSANKAGANTIEDIRFGLHDPRVYWDEAVSLATSNALNDARTIAAAAGLKLVRILSINLESANVASRLQPVYLAKMVSSELNVPIEPSEVTLTANVSISYEIASE